MFDGNRLSCHFTSCLSNHSISASAPKEQYDDLSGIISLQVRQARLDNQETQKRIAVTQQAIAQADENLKVTTDRYQQGLSINTDVLKAEDLRITSHDKFSNASYDSALAT